MATLIEVLNHLSTARMEYKSRDFSVLKSFVVPPYINNNDLAKIEQSLIVEGGRGCGKTMYIRYFSHWTQFDNGNKNVSKEDLDVIILYWKPDTVFCRAMSQNWLEEKNARLFFLSLTALEILKELLFSITNISNHFPEIKIALESNKPFLQSLELIFGEHISNIEAAINCVEKNIYTVEISINSNNIEDVIKTDPKALLNMLVPLIRKACPGLSKSVFKIFVDEFENLATFQQKIINSYRKHSDALLSWNVAHKRNANVTSETEGDENIQESDDYMTILLDEALNDDEYRFLAAEIFILNLYNVGLRCNKTMISPEKLGNRNELTSRFDEKYKTEVNEIVSRIFPTPTIKELAEIAISNKAASKKIIDKLTSIYSINESYLKRVIQESPDVVVATWYVSGLRSFKIEEFNNYVKNNYPKGSYKEKIKTYLFHALLNLNLNNAFIDIPVYAGFRRFCSLSSGNIRHFMVLCYHALKCKSQEGDIEIEKLEDFPGLTYKEMHEGAKNTSTLLVSEVPGFSPMGQTLSTLVNRLGDLFQLAHYSEVQGEPEQNHFYIKSDYGQISEKLTSVITQAKCWRVLIESQGMTKDKKPGKSAVKEYILNPIYTPSFGISYRKIRHTPITENDFNIICFGDLKEYDEIRNRYRIKWKTNDIDTQRTFFDD